MREAITAGTLRPKDKGLQDVVSRFDAMLRFASLQLGRRLGTEVAPALSRRELSDPAVRTQTLTDSMVSTGTMQGAIRIPDTVGLLVVTVDLRANRVACHVDIEAPREGRPTTRVNWLVRQLCNAPESVRVEAFTAHQRGPGQADLLRVIREDPTVLVGDAQRELRSFRVAVTSATGSKRGRGRGTFIDSVLGTVDAFYGEVMQHLKAWSATPPRLRDPLTEPLVETETALDSNALSSQDGAEPPVEPPHAAEPDDSASEDPAVDLLPPHL